MKTKSALLIFLLLAAFCINLNAQTIIYPIPSYDVSVLGIANFQEPEHTPCTPNNEKQKREVIIKAKACGLDSINCSYTVYVYSLDGQTRLGPFTVQCGETLTVGIGDGLWGVEIISESLLCVDVWINEPGNKK